MTQTSDDAFLSALIPEILGFDPTALLDSMYNAADEGIYDCVQAIEEYLIKWNTQERKRKEGEQETEMAEQIEQGLVSFQTLLESHTDIAFDFFETWSKRNIFTIPSDLPIVLPHQEGLNLDQPEDKETELLAEVEELRRKIKNQRLLQRLFQRSIRASSVQKEHSKQRLERLSFLSTLEPTLGSPDQIRALHARLPEFDQAAEDETLQTMKAQLGRAGSGQRPWEESQGAYVDWAAGKLVDAARAAHAGTSTNITPISRLVDETAEVGTISDIKAASEALTSPLDDDRMDES